MTGHIAQASPAARNTEITRFPTRPEGERTLTGMVMQYATQVERYRPGQIRNRVDTYRHALWVGSKELDTRSPTWHQYASCVIGEYVQDVDGEPLGGDTPEGKARAGRLLRRLIATNGALNALRYVAEAIERGAGLGDGHEDDVLAVLKYAAAIARGERRDHAGF